MEQLHKLEIHSVIIEGGSLTLQQFINSNCWDEARVFQSDALLKDGVMSPGFIQKQVRRRHCKSVPSIHRGH